MLEPGILKNLDHPNIVKFHETYEDDHYIHLVTEYCSGGELLERVIEKGSLSENEAALIMKKALSAVKHLHEKNIVHRDLKPENFLFSHVGKDAELKLIDFGLARPIDDIESLKSAAGTIFYMAPEVIRGNFSEKCDEWSLGAIMYLLLSGQPPFLGSTSREVASKILNDKIDMKSLDWRRVSKHAKDLLHKLLERDVQKRITAAEALEHPWFKKIRSLHPVEPVNRSVIQNLRAFKNSSYFRKEALSIMVDLLSDAELAIMKNAFNYCDKSNTGEIQVAELQEVMHELGYRESDEEIIKLIQRIQIDNKDHISYTDFLIAALHSKHYSDKDKLWKIFQHFDVDGAGYITRESIVKMMARGGRKISDEEVDTMIREADFTGDGRISFEEFCSVISDDAKATRLQSTYEEIIEEEEEDNDGEDNDFEEGNISRNIVRE